MGGGVSRRGGGCRSVFRVVSAAQLLGTNAYAYSDYDYSSGSMTAFLSTIAYG